GEGHTFSSALDDHLYVTANLPSRHHIEDVHRRLNRRAAHLDHDIPGPQPDAICVRRWHDIDDAPSASGSRIDAEPEIILPTAMELVAVGKIALPFDIAQTIDHQPVRTIEAIGPLGLPR